MANLTGHADRIGEPGAVIRYGRDGLEMVSLQWGLEPAEPDGRPFEVVRAEGRVFSTRRCLAPASEFFIKRRDQRFRCSLVSGDWFYLAGIWRPASPTWPSSYAVLTIDANADVALYHARQMVVVTRDQRMAWLDATFPEEQMLRPLPRGSFRVEPFDEHTEQQPQLAL